MQAIKAKEIHYRLKMLKKKKEFLTLF